MDHLAGIKSLIISQWADNSTAILVSVAIGLIIVWSYQYYETKFKYWEKRGIKGVRPIPLVSELNDFLFKNRIELARERTSQFGKVYGTFASGKPRLVVNDPDVVRQICIKDFDVFPNHQLNVWANKYQRNSLVWLQDEHWKRVRTMMSPTFTSGKIKRMFKLMDSCADDLVDNFREQLERSRRQRRLAENPQTSRANNHNDDGDSAAPTTVDLYETFSLYTLDGITTCGYGIKLKREINSDNKNTRKPSTRNCLYDECRQSIKFSPARAVATLVVPHFLLKLVGFHMTPERQSRPLMERIKKLIKIRRQLVQDNMKYDDLLQMLVDARLDDKIELNELDELENHHANMSNNSLLGYQNSMKSSFSTTPAADGAARAAPPSSPAAAETKLSDLELLSEASFLLVAGFDTTRSSLSTIVYLLAHHEHIQEKLHEELKKIARWQETAVGRHLLFEYEELTSCQYLDAVVSESLRYLNPAPFTDRFAKADYFIDKYKVTIPAGSQVVIGLHSMHTDPDYWSEPEKFDPDRFYVPELRAQIKPGSYAPFSMGPRHCIGMRFSLTETKLALAKVLMNFKFKPTEGTCFPPKPSLGLGLVRINDCRVETFARY